MTKTTTLRLRAASQSRRSSAINKSAVKAARRLSLAGSVILAPWAWFECMTGTPSPFILCGAAISLIVAAFLPLCSTTANEKGGAL